MSWSWGPVTERSRRHCVPTSWVCGTCFWSRRVIATAETSATSGGGVWIPCNRYAREAGAQDSLEEASEYLQGTIPSGAVPAEMIDTYLREGPRMIDFLHERTRVRYQSLAHYPDYWSSFPGARHGHRSMEPEPVNRDVLGAEASRLRDTHHMMWMFDRIAFTQVEAQRLMAQMPGWRSLMGRLMWQYLSDVPWVLTYRRSRRLACGAAGIARLRWSLQDRNIPLWLNAPMQDLLRDEGGRVVGATVLRGGKRIVVRARYGVVLAAGGFEHNQAMREQYLPKPTRSDWSAAAGTNTGDALRAALAIGAATRLMNGGWWCSSIKAPDDPVPRLAIMEKSYPGSCVVNQRGRRIAPMNPRTTSPISSSCSPGTVIQTPRFRPGWCSMRDSGEVILSVRCRPSVSVRTGCCRARISCQGF